MRLSKFVLESDVMEAIRLMKVDSTAFIRIVKVIIRVYVSQVATQAAATDPRTGTIDMDMITTGRTALDRDLVRNILFFHLTRTYDNLRLGCTAN